MRRLWLLRKALDVPLDLIGPQKARGHWLWAKVDYTPLRTVSNPMQGAGSANPVCMDTQVNPRVSPNFVVLTQPTGLLHRATLWQPAMDTPSPADQTTLADSAPNVPGGQAAASTRVPVPRITCPLTRAPRGDLPGARPLRLPLGPLQMRKSQHGKHKKCPHSRQRYDCPECGGAGICQQGKQRRACRNCQGPCSLSAPPSHISSTLPPQPQGADVR